MNFNVKLATLPEHIAAIKHLRKAVFVYEQGVNESDERDELDELSSTRHFIGLLGEIPIAAGRVTENGKIGRVCVLPNHRGHHYGTRLLLAMIAETLESQPSSVPYLHAQTNALDFYQKTGFVAEGSTFVEADIDHQRMQFDMTDAVALEAAYGDRVWRAEHVEVFRRHISQCARIAQRSVEIFSRDLSSTLFDGDVVESLSSFARSNKHAHIRALIQDTRGLATNSHPLVKLAQRLTSSIELRALQETPQHPNQGFIICDRRRIIFFNDETNWQGFINYRAPAESAHELEEFDNLWRYHSKPDPNLSRLSI